MVYINLSPFLPESDDNIVINNIRQNTNTGRLCGDESFIKNIEGLLERRLTALPRGRPRKRK